MTPQEYELEKTKFLHEEIRKIELDKAKWISNVLKAMDDQIEAAARLGDPFVKKWVDCFWTYERRDDYPAYFSQLNKDRIYYDDFASSALISALNEKYLGLGWFPRVVVARRTKRTCGECLNGAYNVYLNTEPPKWWQFWK